ncbi:MAG: biopolymer transporter ExbD [Oligoflexia bacterium]|nr:biopolymer transporter ExbD [Oligoflexia bacterium]
MRKLRFRDNSEGATFELNLAPMLDMMVTIIPFLLLSAVFLQLAVINVPLPVPVAKALEQDRKNDKPEVTIKIKMQGNKSMQLDVVELSGASKRTSINATNSEFDYQTLHKKLVEVKQRFPKVFKVEISPDESIDYKSIVGVMDSSRNLDNSDPKIKIENAETTLLFPDVILANVME